MSVRLHGVLHHQASPGAIKDGLLNVKWSIRFPFTETAKADLMVAIVLISLAVKLLPIDI